jgi:hypothetical protein
MSEETTGPHERIGFLAGYERFQGVLKHPPRIVDTTQVCNELKSRVRLGLPLGGAITRESVRRAPVLAARHVFDEMYRDDGFGHANKFEKLAEQSALEGWPTEAAHFQAVFETTMLPLIRFVAVGELFEGHAVVASVGNRKDVPTARLALLVATTRPVVLSADSHLNRAGLASVPPGAVLSAFASMEMSELSIYATGYFSISTARRVKELVESFSDRYGIRRHWTWVGLGALGAIALAWALQTPDRRELVGKVVQPVVGLYITVVREGHDAQEGLAALSAPLLGGGTLAQRIAHLLIDGRRWAVASIGGVLFPEESETQARQAEIEATLRALPCFIERADGWQLGECLASGA